MREYVYALHDFLPEHEDEVSLYAGERIEVLEKDDMYGDGWWQGRNLAGVIGLFPVSYTTPVSSLPHTSVPHTSHALTSPGLAFEPSGLSTSNNRFVLQPLAEEYEPEVPRPHIISPVPKHPTTLLNNGYDPELPHENGHSSLNHANGDTEMMKATMTDVEKAIEQLGVGEDQDGARSFSFASTIDGANTEHSDTDFDLSDLDGTEANGNDGDDWHKNARQKLAAKAKRAVEEAERLEEIMGENGDGRRASLPPIEVELSDESEPEMEDDPDSTMSSNFQRNHPYIPEEDEDIGTDGEAAAANGTQYSTIDTLSTAESHIIPPNDENEVHTATKPSFSALKTPVPTESLPETPAEELSTPGKDRYSSSISPLTAEIANGLSSPASVGHSSNHNSMVSSSSVSGMSKPASQTQQQQQPNGTSAFSRPSSIPVSTAQGRNESAPMEWSVEDVVDWLKSKGFDQDVCDKFVEQEITGDVLLELDVNLLKSEIGITAFGKRMRIANVITDLRRPPSVQYSDDQISPMQIRHSNSLSHSHSRTQSQNVSLPGTATIGHTHSYSMQSSFGSPVTGHGGQQSSHLGDSPVDNNDDVKTSSPVGSATVGVAAGMFTAAGVGLGIALSPMNVPSSEKGPPSRLVLSPDGALKEYAAKTATTIAVNGDNEDHGHASNGEIEIPPNPTSIRRRIFGLSHDSAVSNMNSSPGSKGSPLPSPTILDKEGKDNDSVKDSKETSSEKGTSSAAAAIRRVRSKKSGDAKSSDRLSIFGNFGGKNRKPPPIDDTLAEKPSPTEKASKFSLSRLNGSSIRKSSSTASNRPSTSHGSPQGSEFGVSDEQPATLRKRTISNPNSATVGAKPETVNNDVIKEGVSIIGQIGEPDHTGWMRKKADKYNSWKVRYFVLKGSHLYFLRSNSESETRIKGYIRVVGYKVTVDENVDPGRYGFRIDHENNKTHYFSSEEKTVIRDWMKAIMKATILRDYSKPVVSSCNIPTISLVVAQTMNPAPRPPSPSAREATQRALRRENTEELSTRDTRVLMGLDVVDANDEPVPLDASNEAVVKADISPSSPARTSAPAPPRPSKLGRMNSGRATLNQADDYLIQWANTHLPESLQISQTGFLCTGLGLLRIAEAIRGRPSSPPVPDSAFPVDAHDDKLDGLFRLFDFLLDNDVKMGSVSINDVRLGKRDKIIQLLKALKAWEDKRRVLDLNLSKAAGPAVFTTPVLI